MIATEGTTPMKR